MDEHQRDDGRTGASAGENEDYGPRLFLSGATTWDDSMFRYGVGKRFTISSSVGLTNSAKEDRQVFVAYPYKLYAEADYRRVYRDLGKALNVKFVFADEKITDLHILEKIGRYIETSQFGIYDISGWNPNVTLELGLAFGLKERAFIAFDPSRTSVEEVPADLRGIDRIQYGSYTELGEKLGELLAEYLPIERNHNFESQVAQLREQAVALIGQGDGLKMPEIAEALGVSTGIAQVVVRPLVAAGVLRTAGSRRGMKYWIKE